jgi:hypothetical protein
MTTITVGELTDFLLKHFDRNTAVLKGDAFGKGYNGIDFIAPTKYRVKENTGTEPLCEFLDNENPFTGFEAIVL